jgi:MraZ protein
MFLGRYQHTIDDKGRLMVPARFRELLSNGAFVTQGFDGNLMVLTTESFNLISQKIRTMSITDPRARLLKRFLYSSGEQVEVDRAGRILIPQFLRQAAELDGDVIIVGVGEHFEIWSSDQWQEQARQIEEVKEQANLFTEYEIPAG